MRGFCFTFPIHIISFVPTPKKSKELIRQQRAKWREMVIGEIEIDDDGHTITVAESELAQP